MTIEEVIAIAKTLRPNERFLGYGNNNGYWLSYTGRTYYGDSWEEVLRNAGWKG